VADWSATTIAEMATAGGTLILALATFASIRSANRAARTAERGLLAGLRPVLVGSRLDDAEQKVRFQDNVWLKVGGSGAAVETSHDAVYLVMSVRNVGPGMAVLHGWRVVEERVEHEIREDVSNFRRTTRDIYIGPGEMGFWQGAIREVNDPDFTLVQDLVRRHEMISIEVLYSDLEGGQRFITLFAMIPRQDAGYLCTVARHWNLDRSNPR
jgi:hypothetical protein